MEPTKPLAWKRWTQTSKEFPKPKYGFSSLLKKKGDYIVTHPMNHADYVRIRDAAKFWARYHGVRVSINKIKVSADTWEIKIMLIEKHRHELPHRLQRGPQKYL